jgi:transposase
MFIVGYAPSVHLPQGYACDFKRSRRRVAADKGFLLVGIDVAKNDHYACVVTANGTVAVKAFKVTNDRAGFTTLLNTVEPFRKETLIFGLESTSVYGENLITFLYSGGYKVAVINPMLTANKRKIQNRNSTKTDKLDAKLICDYLRAEEYRLLKPNEVEMMQIRGLCRFRMKIRKQKARLKTQLTGFIDQSFPELPAACRRRQRASSANWRTSPRCPHLFEQLA